MDADGGVDRSALLLHGKEAVKAERANAAERINEACDPEIHFHAGKLKEIGIGREPKRRIPAGTFFRMRAEIEARRESARGRDDLWARLRMVGADQIEESMYAESAAIREPLHAERTARYEARKPEIDALKAAGEWPPKSQRATLQTELATAKKERGEWEKDTLEIIELAYEHAGVKQPDLGTDTGLDAAAAFLEAGAGRPEERAAAEAALLEERNSAAVAIDARGVAERALATAELELGKLSNTQTELLTDVHRKAERALPNLEIEEGQKAAWDFVRRELEAARTARKREADRKEREEEEAVAERERLAAAARAEAARQAALADNPYRNDTERELRKGYREGVSEIDKHKGILNRARARKVWPESEAAVAAAGKRQEQRRAVAEANGWDIGQPRRTQSNTPENESGGIGG